MKFIGLRGNILEGITIASRFSNPRGNLPILSNVFMRAEKRGLVLKATNLEAGVVVSVQGKCEEEGEFTVNAKLITDYLLSIPEEKVELVVAEKKLHITAGRYKTVIHGIEAADFPILPEIEGGSAFEVATDSLSAALQKTLFATSPQEMRQELSGIFFSFHPSVLTVAATDSFRLAEQKLACRGDGEKTLIVPHKTLQEVLKISEGTNEKNIQIIIGEGEIAFYIGSVKVFSRLIEGQYPEYQAIIPQQTTTRIIVKTTDFLQAIKTTSLFSQSGLYDVHLKADAKKNQITVFSERSDVGTNTAVLDVDISGDDNEAVLNYRYLLDCVSRIREKETELLVASSSQPVKVRAKGDSDYLYLIMPIRQ
ncbi:MAG TPA: DNA polymerase III subunit beta [Patescibacteria group bacterium]|nr:DNA polymerase III subunit beta [Patescibacteria group bacterium]